jgi:predicted DNA-binding protein
MMLVSIVVRTQIQLTEEQAERLRRLAVQRGVSMAEIVRAAVDRYMEEVSATDEAQMDARAMAVIGRFASGSRDGSAAHDRYLYDAFSS